MVSQVVQTIAAQIGNKALYMMGAKNLVAQNENTLSFRIRGSKKVNYIEVEYDAGMDLYNMRFKKIWGTNVKDVNSIEGVYADMMHELIEENTGLYTKLF